MRSVILAFVPLSGADGDGGPITRRVEPMAHVGSDGSSQRCVAWSVSSIPGTARTVRAVRSGCTRDFIDAIRAWISVAALRVGTAK
jgi:hypothetical protein